MKKFNFEDLLFNSDTGELLATALLATSQETSSTIYHKIMQLQKDFSSIRVLRYDFNKEEFILNIDSTQYILMFNLKK
jgi:hypothetical protein